MGSEGSLWALPPFTAASVVKPEDRSAAEKEAHLIIVAKYVKEDVDENTVIQELCEGEDLAATAGSSLVVTEGAGSSKKMYGVYILGGKSTVNYTSFYKLGVLHSTTANQRSSITKTCLVLPPDATELQTSAAIEGVLLGSYKDTRWKAKKAKSSCCDTLSVVANAVVDTEKIQTVCESVVFTRQLVNAPANVLNAAALADCMKECAECYGLEYTVLEKKECLEKGMGLYMAVAQGATSDPKFIHLTYRPEGPAKVKIGLVGKGIIFDSGGYNLKVGPESMINMMKFDMGGAATVFGAARAIAQSKIQGVEVHFISAACENLISGHAYRPGDVVTASNGKTVEVVNTDAEGRMTLADALVYADGLGLDYLIDIATLTGSMIVGLGNEYAGFFTPNDDIAGKLLASAAATGENLWRMPFVQSYRKLLESNIADIKQLNTRAGDCINAAIFLKEFVQNTPQWAHWDIAGTCWQEREGGATGYGVRSFVNFVESLGTAS